LLALKLTDDIAADTALPEFELNFTENGLDPLD
jgi:hypothetical protein